MIKKFKIGASICFNRQLTGPYEVLLSISNKCSLNCLPCFNLPEREDLDLPTIKRLFDNLDSIKTTRVILAGSKDPLEHKDINELIKYAKTKKFEFGVISNLLVFENIEKVKQFDSILVSLLAVSKPVFSKVFLNRKFETQKKAVDNLQKIKSKVRRISVTLFEQNYEDLLGFLELARKLSLPIYFNYAVTSHKPFLKIQNKKHFESLVKKGSVYSKEYHIKTNLQTLLLKRKIVPCYTGFWQSFIESNGDVFFCCRNPVILGNIKTASFRKIWYSNAYDKLRKKRYSPGKCKYDECLLKSTNQRIANFF